MKKFLIFIGGFVAGIMATILVVFLFWVEPYDWNDVTKSEQSFWKLQRMWHYNSSNRVGNGFISISETIEFGNGNYVFNSETNRSGKNQAKKTEIGTFRILGDSVILTSSDGREKTGIIVGHSLTIDGRTFR